MSNKISFLVAVLAMVGCAGAGPQGAADLGGEGSSEAAHEHGLPSMPGASAVASEAPAQASMMGLAMPIEVFGAPEADVSACVALQMPLNTTSAAHAPALVTPASGSLCAQDNSGMLVLLMPMQTQNVIKLVGPGFSRFHLQVTSAPGAIQMKPVRLLSDAQIGAVYQKLGMTVDAPHTAVIETPADDAQVELLAYGTDEGPAPIYLDAEGNLTERDRSVAGGWAVFANLPQGMHEVFMSHAELTCSPDPVASWAGSTEGSASVLSLGNSDPLAMEPLPIAHSNAFGCR